MLVIICKECENLFSKRHHNIIFIEFSYVCDAIRIYLNTKCRMVYINSHYLMFYFFVGILL